ncbi:MAG TPA: putative porin [Candidatus Ozemobacteraceae bacterium]|nr:putative porin [Candidatus Ozemobacteraceae bacterium]
MTANIGNWWLRGMIVCAALVLSGGGAAFAETARNADGMTYLTGDLSHRFMAKTLTEADNGAESERRCFAERVRLNALGKDGDWNWLVSLSTLDSSHLSSSLKTLAREGNHILTVRDFSFVNLYAQWTSPSKTLVRIGRTQVPFLKFKSEMLWDNDIYWDGLWVEHPVSRLGAAAVLHGGAFEIHRDQRFRGDRLYVLGAMGRPKRGNTQLEWRLDRFQYGIDTNGWVRTSAPGYRIMNAYVAAEWPSQVRVTFDWARNLLADAPGPLHRGGDAWNVTLLLGKMKRVGRFQVITQYFQTGADAVPGSFVPYEKRLNMQGTYASLRYRLAPRVDIVTDYSDWRRIEAAAGGDRRYRRWEWSLNHIF